MKYIVLVESTYQTSEETWARKRFVKTFGSEATLREIFYWVEKNNFDKNTIEVHVETE